MKIAFKDMFYKFLIFYYIHFRHTHTFIPRIYRYICECKYVYDINACKNITAITTSLFRRDRMDYFCANTVTDKCRFLIRVTFTSDVRDLILGDSLEIIAQTKMCKFLPAFRFA